MRRRNTCGRDGYDGLHRPETVPAAQMFIRVYLGASTMTI